jgi:hypothetical protein
MKNKTLSTVGFVILVVLAIGVVYNIIHKKSASTSPKSSLSSKATGCVSQQFNVGSSGHCVNDIQTMVNYIETAGLIQCPFPGAAQQPATGTYDATTQTQVKVVQSWFNCYNKEEGVTTMIDVDGMVGPSTWPELCMYGYKFPALAKQNPSPYFQQTLAAGKDAGCAS